MGRIGMPERVGGKLLLRVYLGTAFLDGPLDARRGKRSYRTILGDLTVENVFYGVFGPEIGHQAPGKVRAQRKITVYLSFLLFYEDRFSIEIYIGPQQVAEFITAKATTVEHGQDQPVLQVFGSVQQLAHLPFVKYHGKVVLPFYAWKSDAFFLHPQHLVGGTEPIDGMFEKALRGRIVKVLAVVQIVVYPLFIEKLRTTFVMERQVGETAQVVP